MLISKTIEIDMGHRLPNHKSKCRNFHGHRYVFEAFVDGHLILDTGDSSEGMILDFGNLKFEMMQVIDEKLDHGFMLSKKDPFLEFFKDRKIEGFKVILVDFVPTVENIGIHVFKQLQKALFKWKIKLVKLKVWETPTSLAEITEKDV